jgi:hypothetical protein
MSASYSPRSSSPISLCRDGAGGGAAGVGDVRGAPRGAGWAGGGAAGADDACGGLQGRLLLGDGGGKASGATKRGSAGEARYLSAVCRNRSPRTPPACCCRCCCDGAGGGAAGMGDAWGAPRGAGWAGGGAAGADDVWGAPRGAGWAGGGAAGADDATDTSVASAGESAAHELLAIAAAAPELLGEYCPAAHKVHAAATAPLLPAGPKLPAALAVPRVPTSLDQAQCLRCTRRQGTHQILRTHEFRHSKFYTVTNFVQK